MVPNACVFDTILRRQLLVIGVFLVGAVVSGCLVCCIFSTRAFVGILLVCGVVSGFCLV